MRQVSGLGKLLWAGVGILSASPPVATLFESLIALIQGPSDSGCPLALATQAYVPESPRFGCDLHDSLHGHVLFYFLHLRNYLPGSS